MDSYLVLSDYVDGTVTANRLVGLAERQCGALEDIDSRGGVRAEAHLLVLIAKEYCLYIDINWYFYKYL